VKLDWNKILNGVVIGLIVAAIVGIFVRSLGLLSRAAWSPIPLAIVIVLVGLLILVIINRQKKISQHIKKLATVELKLKKRDANQQTEKLRDVRGAGYNPRKW
jgi:uncharacterized membrane protein